MDTKIFLIMVAAALAGPADGAHAGAGVEGVVELPKSSAARPLNQRYRADVEVPVAPTDPPIAVVYLGRSPREQ